MRVALVHDFLVEYGGGERVLEALHEIFPGAPIYTAYLDLNGFGPHQERIRKWNIKTSWLQYLPRKLLSPARIFASLAFESFDLSGYDVVISSCNTYFSKAVITSPKSLHISYIHTPPRYLYGYATSFNYKKHWWTRVAGELANHFLRIYDYETSQRPDILVANSQEVYQRIKKFYRREAVVIYPPVDLSEFKAVKKKQEDFFLSLNRLDRGKGTEVAVNACTKLGLTLKVAGKGNQEGRLRKIAGQTVQFLGEVDDKERIELLSYAKALIVASDDEDFGITAIEAQAAGTPVIAIKQGGYQETVLDGKTGLFFEPSTMPADYSRYVDPKVVENLIKVLEEFDPGRFRVEELRDNAEKFSKVRFKEEILALVDKNLKS